MTRTIRKAVVVVLILVGAGVAAAATAPVIVGPPVDIAFPTSPLTQVAQTTGTTATTSGGVTTTTVGDTTTVTGTGGLITGANPITGGTTTPTTPATTPGTIEQIVALTRTVEAGATVNAFVVPATSSLVVTDVVITNPGTTPACGASVTAAGATATGTDLATTGVLCIPPQTSLTLALTTGLEFTSGRTVVLGNQAAGGSGALLYHLRGFLIAGA